MVTREKILRGTKIRHRKLKHCPKGKGLAWYSDCGCTSDNILNVLSNFKHEHIDDPNYRYIELFYYNIVLGKKKDTEIYHKILKTFNFINKYANFLLYDNTDFWDISKPCHKLYWHNFGIVRHSWTIEKYVDSNGYYYIIYQSSNGYYTLGEWLGLVEFEVGDRHLMKLCIERYGKFKKLTKDDVRDFYMGKDYDYDFSIYKVSKKSPLLFMLVHEIKY